MTNNYELRISPNRIPESLAQLSMLALISSDAEAMMLTVLVFASFCVYDLDKDEYIDAEQGAYWIKKQVLDHGLEGFSKIIVEKQIEYLKTQNVHVTKVGENFDPRNN